MKARNVLSALVLFVGLSILALPAMAQRHHHMTIWGADYVDLSHPGYHTHENTIGFGLWRLYMPRATNIQVKAHCAMRTDIWGYGGIENWRTEIQGSLVKIWVPTRLSDALIFFPFYYYGGGWQYAQYYNYWLDVDWDGP